MDRFRGLCLYYWHLVKHLSFTGGLTEAWRPPLKHIEGMVGGVLSLDQAAQQVWLPCLVIPYRWVCCERRHEPSAGIVSWQI